MKPNHLLPYASTDFEHHLTDELSHNSDLPVQIALINQIDEVGADFLSFLAWQYSVDSWNNDWQPSLQRELIKQSFHQHQIKGTIAAIRQILHKFGYEATFTEWWQANPPLPAGSFTLELSTAGLELSESVYLELNRLINDAKPVSRHLTNLRINLTPRADVYLGVGVQIGDCIEILPR